MREQRDTKVVIIGAGPAGLTAAFELCKAGIEPVVSQAFSTSEGTKASRRL